MTRILFLIVLTLAQGSDKLGELDSIRKSLRSKNSEQVLANLLVAPRRTAKIEDETDGILELRLKVPDVINRTKGKTTGELATVEIQNTRAFPVAFYCGNDHQVATYVEFESVSRNHTLTSLRTNTRELVFDLGAHLKKRNNGKEYFVLRPWTSVRFSVDLSPLFSVSLHVDHYLVRATLAAAPPGRGQVYPGDRTVTQTWTSRKIRSSSTLVLVIESCG